MVLITIVTGANLNQLITEGASHCIYLYTYGDDWGMVNLLHCFTHMNPNFLLLKLPQIKNRIGVALPFVFLVGHNWILNCGN